MWRKDPNPQSLECHYFHSQKYCCIEIYMNYVRLVIMKIMQMEILPISGMPNSSNSSWRHVGASSSTLLGSLRYIPQLWNSYLLYFYPTKHCREWWCFYSWDISIDKLLHRSYLWKHHQGFCRGTLFQATSIPSSWLKASHSISGINIHKGLPILITRFMFYTRHFSTFYEGKKTLTREFQLGFLFLFELNKQKPLQF